jgi:hypothetical protein
MVCTLGESNMNVDKLKLQSVDKSIESAKVIAGGL